MKILTPAEIGEQAVKNEKILKDISQIILETALEHLNEENAYLSDGHLTKKMAAQILKDAIEMMENFDVFEQ